MSRITLILNRYPQEAVQKWLAEVGSELKPLGYELKPLGL